MNTIEARYETLESDLSVWNQRLDEFAKDVRHDASYRKRIDELKLKKRLALTALEDLRSSEGRRWETTKVVVSRLWRWFEVNMDALSAVASPPPRRP